MSEELPEEIQELASCQIFSYDADGRLAVVTNIFRSAECPGDYVDDADAVSSDRLSAEDVDVDCPLSAEDETTEREEAGRDEPAEASGNDNTGTGKRSEKEGK